MRVLFSTLTAYGHFFQVLPLAVAAHRAGHHVTFATGEVRHKLLTELGLDVVKAGGETEELVAEAARTVGVPPPSEQKAPDRAAMELISREFCRLAPKSYVDDLLPEFERSRPDLVVHASYNPGAGLAAKVAGIPALCHASGRVRPADDYLMVMSEDVLREYATELGLELPATYTTYLGHPYLDICPRSLQDQDFVAACGDLRSELRPVGFNTPGELPAWVRERAQSRPLVYLTLGTESDNRVLQMMRETIAGLSSLDVDVFVATPKLADELGTLPDNVRVERWVAQAELLPHVDLVVQHGGNGTTFGALGSGIPQLFLQNLPGPDQLLNAGMVCDAGAGERLKHEEVTEATVATAARRLLSDPECVAAAKEIARQVAEMPSPDEVARRLPEYAG
ncbi:glycosyltransferase [Actinophytocola sp. NPDC049390]|uniref:glycosyltransferase n=1 Tax=Actinophytocola sp. NPDC049390 TaxID=3363894 RepID=UPI0037A1CA0D